QGERDPGQGIGDQFGRHHPAAVGGDQEGLGDGLVAELPGHAKEAQQQRGARQERHRGGDDRGQAVGRQRRAAVPPGVGAGGGHRGDREGGHDGGHAVEEAGGAQLSELGADKTGHDPAPCWLVSWRKTSSRLEPAAPISWMTIPAAAAAVPTTSVVVPTASSWSAPSGLAWMPWAASSDRRVSAWGGRAPPSWAGRAVRAARVDWVTSRPEAMITTWSTVWATSARTWLETSTVRPWWASSRRNQRSQWTPSGSRPLAGPSRISTWGAPSRAAP